jgi:hypothetical protein
MTVPIHTQRWERREVFPRDMYKVPAIFAYPMIYKRIDVNNFEG